jgi:7-cyano-7-deazaguanine synthase
VTGAAFAASRDASKLFSAFINSNQAYEIDATTAFLASAEGLLAGCGDVKLEMPFRVYSKSEVARLGVELNVPIARYY